MTLAEDGVRRGRGSAGVRTAVVWEALRPVLGGAPLDVVDVGGGTGHFAVPLAELGHKVTVVDSNPDALAALERRADEAGVIVVGRQADAHELLSVVEEGVADLVLCHSVLEYVEDPARALAALTGAARPGGSLSVLVAGS
ncbi:methyltransferase domain-containing protein, partial [Actinocorallia lasiicapitis]